MLPSALNNALRGEYTLSATHHIPTFPTVYVSGLVTTIQHFLLSFEPFSFMLAFSRYLSEHAPRAIIYHEKVMTF